ncbi:MAG: TIM barrel protein, partial [Candidatus Eremiobacteraeota bacterium]|nr:TIM barrel protein [Candidatus Eremiobacteraeota bacterium]
MPKLAANLTWLFNELPFIERFEAAAACGFRGVEMLFPYELSARTIGAQLKEHGLELVLFNLPPGDFAAGERGLAGLPGREAEFDAAVETALAYARECGCARVHAMAGNVPADTQRAACDATYVANLRRASRAFASANVTLLIEPLNAIDNPQYFLKTTREAIDVMERVGETNLALQLDLYHTPISEGDLERRIRSLDGRFAHVQIAGNPWRREPDEGEVNYAYLLAVLDEIGYDGWVGCEYR